jgi:hypothetical protein
VDTYAPAVKARDSFGYPISRQPRLQRPNSFPRWDFGRAIARCSLTIEAEPNTPRLNCFAPGDVADQLEERPDGVLLSGTLVCLGEMKVITNDLAMDLDEDRGVDYPVAWLIKSAKRA